MNKNLFFDLNDLKYCGKNVIIGKTVRIRQPHKVFIGDGTIIDDFTYISGNVSIGAFTHIASSCTLQASSGEIKIGGPNTVLKFQISDQRLALVTVNAFTLQK